VSKKRINEKVKRQRKKIEERIQKVKDSKHTKRVQAGVKKVKQTARIEESQEIHHFMGLPDYITLGNALAGTLSMILSFSGKFNFAIILMFVSLVLDAFDGAVARKLNKVSNFGKQMDSLADLLAFGLAPVVFGFMQIRTSFAMAAYLAFIAAGLLRLARYNVTKMKGYYYGMPITLNALFIPLIFILNVPLLFYPYIYIILAFLMITPFKIKKI